MILVHQSILSMFRLDRIFSYLARFLVGGSIGLFSATSNAEVTLSLETISSDADWALEWSADVHQKNIEAIGNYSGVGPIRNYFCQIISLKGEIEIGDAKRFAEFLDEHTPEYDIQNAENIPPNTPQGGQCHDPSNGARILSTPHNLLILDSEGGNFLEAVEIASLVQQTGFTTIVPEGAKCLSACTLLFMSGSYQRNRLVTAQIPSRWMHVSAMIGFHAPFPNYGGDQEYTAQNAKQIYGVGAKQIVEYAALIRLGTRKDFLSKVLQETSPEKFLYISTVSDAIDWGVDIYGYRSVSEDHRYAGALQACIKSWTTRDFGPIDNAGLFIEATEAADVPSDLKDQDVVDISEKSKFEIYQIDDENYYFADKSKIEPYEVTIQAGHARWPHDIICSVDYNRAEKESVSLRLVSSWHNNDDDYVQLLPYWYLFPSNTTLSSIKN